MSIPREIICAGAHLVAKYINVPPSSTDAAVMAKGLLELLAEALPHLAPKPSGSDDERAEEIARAFTPVDMGGTVKARTERILAFVSTVRAEERATQATQIAALREAVKLGRLWIEADIESSKFGASAEEIKSDLTISCGNKALRSIDAALEMSGGASKRPHPS